VVLADRIRRYAQTVSWNLDEVQRAADVQRVADEMVAAARADARSAGIDVDLMQISRIGAFRFRGQVWEIDISLGDAPLNERLAGQLKSRFIERYEEIYGKGTAWKDAPVVMLDYEIITSVANSERRFHRWVGGSEEPQPRTIRRVVLPTDRQPAEVPVYDYGEIGVGARISGPAIIDAGDTTIYVPASFDMLRGELGELELTL
jgi:N-methylhydantoinase A